MLSGILLTGKKSKNDFKKQIMKSTVAIYNSQLNALNAVEVLKNKNYPVNQISVLGQVKNDNDVQIRSIQPAHAPGAGFGVVIDSTLAMLSGARILCVQGLGFIFCAGVITSSVGGFYLGLTGMGIVTILSTIGIKNKRANSYSMYLKKGKFLVIAQGNKKEIEKAKNILNDCGKYFEPSID
jgi:hypothetical protein